MPSKEVQEEVERREREYAAREAAKPKVPLPESPSAYEGLPNSRSTRSLEKIRGLSRTLSAQLAEARNAHIVRITSMATELVDVQNDHIAALEKRLKFYDDWEDSREVKELIDKNEQLELELAELREIVGNAKHRNDSGGGAPGEAVQSRTQEDPPRGGDPAPEGGV